MPCCSKNRDTFGIIIGCTCTLCNLIVVISSLFSFMTSRDVFATLNDVYPSMIIFLSATLISALYVLAIIKKLPMLILPWLLFCVAVLWCSCYIMYAIFEFFYDDGWVDIKNKSFLIMFIIAAGIIGIEIATFLYSCWLCIEIHKENSGWIEVNNRNDTANFNQMSEKSFV